jgi:peptidoglycan-N-acetylglucosamine deacetylase
MKKVYLTVDDAPSKDFIKKVDFLHKEKIPAIFFCIGKMIKGNEDKLIYAIKKGFVIGNHSYSHKRFNLISLRKVRKEISKTDSLINGLYEGVGVERKDKFFRFPYGIKGEGTKKDKIQNILNEFGYKQPNFGDINYPHWKKFGLDRDLDVFWTIDAEEYMKPWKDVLKKLKQKNPKQGGNLFNEKSRDILLIHDHENTTEVFFKIIKELKKMNIKFLSASST